MRHEMRLQHDPFVKIAEQTKTIEMRLLDEKRSSVSAGDLILFTDINNNEKVECLVTNIYRYPSFEELYRHHSKNSIGYDEDEPADPKDMLAISPVLVEIWLASAELSVLILPKTDSIVDA